MRNMKRQLLRGLQETHEPSAGLRPTPPDRHEDMFAWLFALIGVAAVVAAIFWL